MAWKKNLQRLKTKLTQAKKKTLENSLQQPKRKRLKNLQKLKAKRTQVKVKRLQKKSLQK